MWKFKNSQLQPQIYWLLKAIVFINRFQFRSWNFCNYCCCSAYLSCHRTASGANWWTISKLLNAINTSCLDQSCMLWIFQWFNIPVGFFEFLSMEFVACSKPPSRDSHCKSSYPRTHQRDQNGGLTQIISSELSLKRCLCPFGKAEFLKECLVNLVQ